MSEGIGYVRKAVVRAISLTLNLTKLNKLGVPEGLRIHPFSEERKKQYSVVSSVKEYLFLSCPSFGDVAVEDVC